MALLAAHRGVRVEDLAAVTAQSAHRAMVATCPPDGAFWTGLLPRSPVAGQLPRSR
jgi:hypothetical protein